jgi:hypothetical protein
MIKKNLVISCIFFATLQGCSDGKGELIVKKEESSVKIEVKPEVIKPEIIIKYALTCKSREEGVRYEYSIISTNIDTKLIRNKKLGDKEWEVHMYRLNKSQEDEKSYTYEAEPITSYASESSSYVTKIYIARQNLATLFYMEDNRGFGPSLEYTYERGYDCVEANDKVGLFDFLNLRLETYRNYKKSIESNAKI